MLYVGSILLAWTVFGPQAEPAQDPAVVPASLAELLPEDALLYLKVGSLRDLPARLEGTAIGALLQEPELQRFLRPIQEGIREDLAYLLREDKEVHQFLEEIHVGAIEVALQEVDLAREEITLTLAADLGESSRRLFELLLEMADDNAVEVEVGGRRALQGEEGELEVLLILDGSRWILTVGPEGHGASTLAGRDDPLAQAAWFRDVEASMGMADPLVFVAIHPQQILAQVLQGGFEAVVEGEGEDDEERERNAEFLRRAMSESPTMKGIEGFGFGIGVEGQELHERWYAHAPGDRSAWRRTGPVGETPRVHAALADPDADLFGTFWWDPGHALVQQEQEAQRIAALHEATRASVDLEEFSQNVLAKLLLAAREKAGLDVQDELLPLLGEHVSFYVDVPPSFALQLPDAGLIVELSDPERFDSLLERVAGQKIEGLSLTTTDYKDHHLLMVTILNAGLPAIPTFCRHEQSLLITLTPQSMKAAITNLQAGASLASSERFASFEEHVPGTAAMALWMDSGAAFQFLYSLVGFGLSSMRMAGVELSERLDPSLLPAADTFLKHLGHGFFIASENEQGLYYDGRSTLGNPITGVLEGLAVCAGYLAYSEMLHEEAGDARRRKSQEHLRSVADAMRAYKNSLGGGTWPTSLTALVDRGILLDAAVLVDPADPSPKKVRTGTGERLSVSYAVGQTDALSAELRTRFPRDCEQYLYTRGAWHTRFGSKHRLAVALTDEAHEVVYLPADEDP